jgi:aminoglycoside phosphotransferase (APT) family kinase protein
MDPIREPITNQIARQLSQLLGLEISEVQSEDLEGDISTILRIISVSDRFQTKRRFVLKKQDDRTAFRFYTHYLKPFDLNSPKEYGYISIDGQDFLVMDYVSHTQPDWSDSNGYLRAAQWLIKKDLVTAQHLSSIRSLDCFGEMEYYGVQYWLSELKKWAENSPSNSQARHVLRTVHMNQARIDTYIKQLNSAGVQTVVHGDLHLSNILFGDEGFEDELFVIDWTEPHIGSVTKDLASLYDNAPRAIKEELIKVYREQIDFPAFDEMFAKAKLLRDIGYLSWMAGVIAAEGREAIDQNELDRVVESINIALDA